MGPVGCQGVVRVIGIMCVMGGSACYGGLASDVMGSSFYSYSHPCCQHACCTTFSGILPASQRPPMPSVSGSISGKSSPGGCPAFKHLSHDQSTSVPTGEYQSLRNPARALNNISISL